MFKVPNVNCKRMSLWNTSVQQGSYQIMISDKEETGMVHAVSFVNSVSCFFFFSFWQPQWLMARPLPTQQWMSLSAPRSHLPRASRHWTAEPLLAHTCWRCQLLSNDSKTHCERASQPRLSGYSRAARRSEEPTVVRQVPWAARRLRRMMQTV